MNDTITRANAQTPATARVRALANRSSVALAGVQGTGSGGRITMQDVHRATPAPAPARVLARATPATVPDSSITGAALYDAVFGPAAEQQLTAAQTELYAAVYGTAAGRA